MRNVSFLDAAVVDSEGDHYKKAQAYLRAADEIGKRIEGRNARDMTTQAKLPPNFYTRQEISFLLLAAEAFRVCGESHWFDSACGYGRAAFTESLHDPATAAKLFVQAGIVAEKIDANFASEYYRKAASQHCDAAEFGAAALIRERMAINFHKKGEDAVAIEEYQRASKLYSAAKMIDDSDRTLERAAHLLGTTKKYKESASIYQTLAIRYTHENLKKFNAPNLMMRGALLLILDCVLKSSESNELDEAIEYIESMCGLDCRFSESPQHDFVVDIIQCVRQSQTDTFVDCIYSFNTISQFDELMLTALNGINEAIVGTTKSK